MSDKHVRRAPLLIRETLVGLMFAFMFGYFIYACINYIEPENRALLQSRAEARSIRTESIHLPRAAIVDRNGETLAISSETYTLGIDATIYNNSFNNAYLLSSVTDLPPRTIIAKVTQKPNARYIRLSKRLTPAYAEQVRKFAMPGVSLEKRFERFYPTAEIASQLVGITNRSEQGISGLELAYDQQLRSIDGKQRVLVTASRKVIENIEEITPAQPGKTLRLTIDIRLQNLAFHLLQQHVTRTSAESGSVLMLDATTGEVLVAANYPANNPNYRQEFNPGLQRNRIFTDVFEPGSTIKPLLVAAVLNHDIWSIDTPVPIGNGVMKVDQYTIRDVGRYGRNIPIATVLTKSSNIGAAVLGLELGSDKLIDSYLTYGFTATTGSNFPGEVAGSLPLAGTISKSRNATMSYGYGFDLTLAQLTRGYLALAQDGVMPPLRLIQSDVVPPKHEVVMRPEVAQQMRAMLVGVTQPGGTAPNAAIAGYQVAGKTGTVHIQSGGKYSSVYNGLFIGMAPAAAPKLITAVIVRKPRGNNYYGSENSAPVFQELMVHSLRLLRIGPDV